MAKEYFYDKRDLSGTETQFFHESRIERTNKEIDTNMERAGEFIKDFTIKRIIVDLPTTVISSSTAKDTDIIDEIVTLLKEGVIELQVGDGDVKYFPLSRALGNNILNGSLMYTLGTSADGSYGLASAGAGNGECGLEVDIVVPKGQMLKFFIKTATSVSLSDVKVILEGEMAE